MHAADDHYERAIEALADRRYEPAGDALARAAWRTLAEPRPEQDPFAVDEKGWVGEGIGRLLTSAICYRVTGRPERAGNRGTEARAVAADFETALDHPAQRACLREMAADARVVGGAEGASDAYADAAEAYREAADAIDDPHEWSTTPLFQAAAAPLRQLARSRADGEIAVSWEDLHGPDPTAPGEFLAHRATVKRQQLPALLEAVVDDGYLAAPRGTTEYNNANYRCPRCGSTDVNWIAEQTLCLRCSAPMERR